MEGRNQRRRSESGAAAVEMAVVLPLLLFIIFGGIEFGLMLFNKQMLTNASREGARYGIVARAPRRTSDEIEIIVNHYCATHLRSFGDASPEPDVKAVSAATGAEIDPSAALFGDDLTVSVTYKYTFLVFSPLSKLFGVGFAGWKDLGAQTVMRYE